MLCGPKLKRPSEPRLGVALLDGPAVAVALFEQLLIGLDVGIGWVLGAGFFELLVGAGVVAAQHVGEALVVEDFGRRADEAQRRRISAVGEIETMQPVVGRGEPDPGAGVVRMLFHGSTEALFGETEIVAAEIFLAA